MIFILYMFSNIYLIKSKSANDTYDSRASR